MTNILTKVMSKLDEETMDEFKRRDIQGRKLMAPEAEYQARVCLLGIVLHDITSERIQSGQYDLALESCKLLTKVCPKLAEAYRDMGIIYVRMHAYGCAEQAFYKAHTLSPDEDVYLNDYFVCMANLNKYQEIHDEGRKLHKKYPDMRAPMHWIGVALASLNEVEQAIRWFKKAIVANDEDNAARIGLAEAYIKLGKYDHASCECADALQEEPTNTKALELLAKSNFGKGELGLA